MIEKFEDTPFEKNNQTVIDEDNYYKIYEDKWPVCDGHLLFVPKENNTKFITITLQATVQYGEKLVEEGKIDGYHFGMNMREPAGQSVMWPHVHFIPRHEGDVDGFPGSIRFAHRNGRGPSYYLKHPKYKEEYKELHKHVMHEEGFIYDE
jgi:diadenosine tetraphosphate (Ap4A) HIT family hydrolase